MTVRRLISREVRRLATGREETDRLKAHRTQVPGQLERDQCTHTVAEEREGPVKVAQEPV